MSQFHHAHYFLFRLAVIVVTSSAAAVTSKSSSSYLLSCGVSSKESDPDGRVWVPDSGFLSSTKNSVTVTAQSQDPLLPSTVPYMSARVFTAESSYRFSIPKKTRFWVRLHFYPANYSGLASTDSYMDVTINGFTLLRNFSTHITCLALTQTYIIREFSLAPTDSGSLTITFVPSHDGAYAFINGIEVIPTPDIFANPVDMVGFSTQQSVTFDTSTFQTMYRLNVGGHYIPPSKDSPGMSRTWYDDTPYVLGSSIGITTEANKSVSIRYSKSRPDYYAPPDVYTTSRSMGPEPKLNLQYNLTWVFNVDANFTYLVRFHFCDYRHEIMNQIVFSIYLNNQTAEEMADIIGWSGHRGTPIFVDYGIYVDEEVRDDSLWVGLHPSTLNSPQFYDAFLNGLEVFKISDGAGNLAGRNPEPSEMLARHEAEMMRSFALTPWYSSTITRQVIGGVGGALAGLGIVVLIALFVRRRKRKGNGSNLGFRSWLPINRTSSETMPSSSSGRFSDLASSLCRHFSLSEIRHATKNFNDSQVIGVGGFGKVFKGVVDSGKKVAIKRSNPSSEQGVHEFQTEIEMLSKLRHKHLVSLIGFCKESGEMILVYDYMGNGTLREHLYGTNNPPLSWKQRLEICIGAARGLHYLHTGAKHTIIHRDVKTTNILLDEKWVAKVSDFGLSKAGPNLGQTHVSTMVKGSFGYLDPEYFRRQQLTDKSDVYSFGVVLFEALSGKPALNATLPKEQVSLADWARACLRNGTLEEIVDPYLEGKINPECFQKFVEIAGKCLAEQGFDRPAMGDVLWNLEFALQLEENPKGTKRLETHARDVDPYHDMTTIGISDNERLGPSNIEVNKQQPCALS